MSVFDRKYCIVDNMGNYYTVNEYDALVEAKSEESAMWFDILEANKRINNSGMSKMLRTVPAKKNFCQKKVTVITDSEEISMQDIDFARMTKELLFLQENLSKYQNELRKKLSAVDEEICDILHFIELYQRDEEQSLDLVDRIQNCRQRRRKIKDEMYRAESFERIFNTGGITNILKTINKRLDKMEVREYTPRRLPGLFVEGIKLEDVQEEKATEASVEEYSDIYWEDNMVYERNDTIFDGKKNNWEDFVSQQQEFFKNIEQYAINLQLDIQELDGDIENLMLTCEDANCNVAQGYKMFKQLKELRLTRKEKLEELDKISVIIESFDCNGMASAYSYCAEVS